MDAIPRQNAPFGRGKNQEFLDFAYQAPQNTRLELKPVFWAKSIF